MSDEEIVIEAARLEDQGKLGALLIDVYGDLLQQRFAAAKKAGDASLNVEDELMAADDFYFSSPEMMDCCLFAKKGDTVVGAACVNPYTSELQYIAIRSAFRMRGWGRKLVEAALDELRRHGCNHVKIDLLVDGNQEETEQFLQLLDFMEISTVRRMGRAL